MKYSEWQVAEVDRAAISRLTAGGFSPLTAAVLASRGYTEPKKANEFIDVTSPLEDPYLLKDMDLAVARIRIALAANEKIAVFGDYDVDGITATSLLTDFLRRQGGNVIPYIPSRLEEGYGLNEIALRCLAGEEVSLIVTVDCGVTAIEEAELCRELGMELVITDHHECKSVLPGCCAVIDPHRKDDTYPHRNLSGVGVAFKLAAAISGDQYAVLDEYCDLVCLGTVADVMRLPGENRVFVTRGLKDLQNPRRIGLRALIQECGCSNQPVTAGTVGYILAPRINAAGRMGQVYTALNLFLATDKKEAAALSERLCQLNRQRQSVEAEIYRNALSMLPPGKPDAIVLSNPDWHQGVVGIVASRLSEEYSCPAFLICPDSENRCGKASSRSYGGFNLFAALEELSPMLESYGGHELAAGFTIRCDRIDRFREEISRLSREFREAGLSRTFLEIDYEVPPELLTISNVEALDRLEPCGSGCPRPVFCISHARVEQVSEVGGGRHLRLRLHAGSSFLSAIFFSVNTLSAGVDAGDLIDVAFSAQINEFRGTRSVQLNLIDLRPCEEDREREQNDNDLYSAYRAGSLTSAQAAALLPPRTDFVGVWRYLFGHRTDGRVEDTLECLTRKVSRYSGIPCSSARLRIILAVFSELGLVRIEKGEKTFSVYLTAEGRKVDLDKSEIIRRLRAEIAG